MTLQEITDRFTERRHVGDRQYQARLVIDHQSFSINHPQTAKQADWTRRQLAIAILRLIEDNQAGVEPCCFCGYKFDQERLGRYGCANCHGEGLDD